MLELKQLQNLKLVIFCILGLINTNAFAQISPSGLVENKGQILNQFGGSNNGVKFLHVNGPLHLQLNENGFSYEIFETLSRDESKRITKYKIQRIDIEFVDNSQVNWIPKNEKLEHYNYYGSKKIENVRAYNEVKAENVWPGVGVRFKIDSLNNIKYEIIASDPQYLKNVAFRVNGVDKIEVKPNEIKYFLGENVLVDQFPAVFSTCENKLDPTFNIKLTENNLIRFESKSKRRCEYVIDPIPNLKWATYFGSTGSEHGYGVAADSKGDPFFCGSTTSSSNIATSGVGVYQVNYSGSDDAYLVKFLKDVDGSSQKSVRVWCTYFGDKGTDVAYDLAIDSGNYIYLVGESYYQSTSSILYKNNLQSAHGGKIDGFIAKFDKDGKLKWSNFFGGAEDDIAKSVFIGAKDTTIVVVGQTASSFSQGSKSGFSIAQSNSGGGTDGFVLVLDSTGSRKFSTYYGGSGTDILNDVTISKDTIFVVDNKFH